MMEKGTVPKEVAEYIVYCKTWSLSIRSALKKVFDIMPEHSAWVMNNSNEFAKAWVNGYIIEEKYYYVAIPGWLGKYKMVLNFQGLEISSGNYNSKEEVKKYTRNNNFRITEEMIKESPLSWAWQFAKELEE